jgi:hypothetical protein
MARPVTLFTGQWADLPLRSLARSPKAWATTAWSWPAGATTSTCRKRLRPTLCEGQTRLAASARPAVLRHRQPPGGPGGVRPDRRAPPVHPAGPCLGRRRSGRRAPARGRRVAGHGESRCSLRREDRHRLYRLIGLAFAIYAFPPTTQAYWDKGFADFARRFLPILDVFEKQDINFALEVHPTEIAFDIASAQRAVEAVKGHKRFGFNFDPSHLGYQGVDYVKFLRTFPDRIYNVHMKDVWWGKRRRHGRRVRRPHQLWRRAALLGLPQRGPRHDRFRIHHRRPQRHRLRRPAVGGVGRQPHGPRPRRHRERRLLQAAGLSSRPPARSTPCSRGRRKRKKGRGRP